MYTSTDQKSKTRVISKKSLPFKAPSPLLKRNNQKPLNFFLSRSKSSLEDTQKKKPLEFKSDSQLNRPTHVPLISLAKSNSTLSQMTRSSNSFNEEDVIDLTQEDKPVPKNFKTSAEPGSLITRPSREGRVSTLYTQTSSFSTLSSSSSSSQGQLSLGSRQLQPSQKRKNPWESSQSLGKKNPRLKQATTQSSVQSHSYRSMSGMNLSSEQQHVLKLVENGRNVFYTGSAGTGKSVLLKEIVTKLRNKWGARAVAVTASTGLAAVNVGGQTINRFSCMGIGDQHPAAYIGKIKKIADVRENWKRTKVLIIDEISMLDGKFLDKLDAVARGVRGIPNLPFGGMQVIMTGDFFQLPPVPDRNGVSQFGFESKSWRHIDHTILLHQVFRQADSEFVDLLNAVRVANVTDEIASSLAKLSREVHYEDGIMPTELYATRQEVESSNRRRLDQLPGKGMVFNSDDTGKTEMEKKQLENTMALKTLTLKEDAQVMMLKNKDETLVNGSVGIVLAFLSQAIFSVFKQDYPGKELYSNDVLNEMRLISQCYECSTVPNQVLNGINKVPSHKREKLMELATKACIEPKSMILPVIKFSTPSEPRVELINREPFTAGGKGKRDDEEEPTRFQLPLLLSWALSIHKSQGQTLQRVRVDLNKVFEAGQVYVSLSRAVSKDSLQILNFSKTKIRANDKVKQFYDSLQRY